ncbi:hypothetical protein K402DRAFT_454822 [Aulographum hederae CBS 113979]|uniref:Uncharacterized protein n=1 Tax=Aulographum hederae CBS 113979 TaxID=1176131 RepID=A0A6G1GXZ5_9PEZI|nr:hypothetical protein K402DRAFT_454822 [Aulographum hederae CBS 113979]
MNESLAMSTGGEPNPRDKTGLCLLSLDGGGVRGLSTLFILKSLMERLNDERQKENLPAVKPCDVFDLIGGTNTGGFVCAIDRQTSGITCLRSYGVPGKANISPTICEAALATSAATSFFDPVKIGARQFEDGGLGVNNPAEQVEEEAADIWCSNSRKLMPLVKCFVSIGTGNSGKKAIEDTLPKFLSKTLVDLVTETVKTESRIIARWGALLTEKRYFRLNVEQGLQDVGLTEYREQGRIEAATYEYLDHMQQQVQVRDCIANLKEKESGTHTNFEAFMKECTVRMHQLQLQPQSHAFHNIPFPSNNRFVGHSDKMEWLAQAISKTRKIAITGLGGIGKTQLALALAYRIREESPGCSIFWIPAMSRDGLEQAFADIVRGLRIPGWDAKGADSKALLQHHLSRESAGRWLLIVDNADDIKMWLEKDGQQKRLIDQLPGSEKGCTLFTTRDRKAAVTLAHQAIITVDNPDEQTAMQMLHGYLVIKKLMENTKTATKLLGALAFLPLAIVQAAAYINVNTVDLATYLELLEVQEEEVIELLSDDFEDEHRYPGTKNPIAATWLISFEQIRSHNPLAADYLSFIACVEPKNVPHSMLPAAQSRKQEIDAVGMLKAYSFVAEREGEKSLDMHRLVHLATRNWLRNKGAFQGSTTKATQHLSEVFPEGGHENRSIWRLYLPHARRLLRCEAPGKNEEERVVNAQTNLRCRFARCLFEDGKYDEATIDFTRVVEDEKRKLGDEHPDTLNNMHSLALTFSRQGRWVKAEELFVQVVEIQKKIQGEEDLGTLNSMNGLASTILNQGRWEEAEELYAQVINAQKKVVGEKHLDTLSSMSNLASTLTEQGRWKEAEELQVRVLETRKEVLGEKHPNTLLSINNLVLTFMTQDRWKEAEELQVRVLATQKEVLGEKHPHTLVRVLATQKEVLGEKHPHTLVSMNNLAMAFQNQGRWKEAEELQVLGASHPKTVASLKWLDIWRKEAI